jgi:hypothetical protein
MKATITNSEHEYFGRRAVVIEILHHRIACLAIDGRKIDCGLSEVRLEPDAALGKEILWVFRQYEDGALRSTSIRRMAKRAAVAWKQRVGLCESALNAYLFQ